MSNNEVTLTGLLQGGLVAIGGETTGFELQVRVEVDLSHVPDAARHLTGKNVAVQGEFVRVRRVERGDTYVFKATAAHEAGSSGAHAPSPAGTPGGGGASGGAAAADTGVGYSNNLSFDEAFRDAVDNLPAVSTPIADFLDVVHVADISAEFGGIAGFHRLRVTVTRPRAAGAPAAPHKPL